MLTQDYISFELELIESSGSVGDVGSPYLFCWVKAFLYPGHSYNGKVVILQRDLNKKWQEHSREITENEIKKIFDYIKQLGIPNHLPEIYGLGHTFDGWKHLSLKIKFEDKCFYLDKGADPTRSWGFGGKDADNLEVLFRYILNLK